MVREGREVRGQRDLDPFLRNVNFIGNREQVTGNETCISGREVSGNAKEGLGQLLLRSVCKKR